MRDLPASTLGIDVENGYKPKYITIKGKQKLVKELKAEAKKCDGVLLATDPDREGEAISWHLANILGLDPAAPNRVTFDEITKRASRRVWPIPVPSTLICSTPSRPGANWTAWWATSSARSCGAKVRRGLSAGRVQSVAVRLIRDRELEIENFKPDEYWNIDAALYPQTQQQKRLYGPLAATADGKKLTVTNKEQADTIVAALDGKSYTISKMEKGKRRRQPAPPFITSTSLQQDASRAFWLFGHADDARRPDPVRGRGHCGARHGGSDHLHAYRLAAHCCRGQRRRQTVHRRAAGATTTSATPRKWKSRSATAAQDAHEAIRPSMPELTPDEVEQSISGDTAKLYRLIWSRFMASQMADCIQDTVSVSITAGDYLSVHLASACLLTASPPCTRNPPTTRRKRRPPCPRGRRARTGCSA